MAFLPAFSSLLGIVDGVLAGLIPALARDKVDTRFGIKIGADVAELGFVFGIPGAGDVEVLYIVAGIITLLEQLNGFGRPVTGGRFTEGRSTFYNYGTNDVYDLLDRASLTDRSPWRGPAADRYDKANTALMGLINADGATMVAADNKMAEIVARQAEQVETVGEGLAGTRLTVLGAIPVAAAMAAAGCASAWIAGIGEAILAALKNFVWGIAAAVGATAVGLLSALVVQALDNRSDVFAAIREYDAAARTADAILNESVRMPAAPHVPAPSGSAGFGLTNISGIPSDLGGAVAVGAVSPTGAGDDSSTPQPPAASELTQLSKGGAIFAGQLAQAMGAVTQGMGQVQQFVSMAQQAAPPKQAPDKKEAPGDKAAAEAAAAAQTAPGQDVAAAGTAPDAASAPGVPVEVVTAGAEHNPDPNRAQRLV